MFLTHQYRIKDGGNSTRRTLRKQAQAVNFVWNYCCEIDRIARDRWKAGRCCKRPSAFDLANLCRGISQEIGIHSDTVDAVCARFVTARNASFPNTPRFRSRKRNLDWIPVSNFARPASLRKNVLTFRKRRYYLWLSRPIPENGKPKSWSFSTDARGRWYVNIQVELPDAEKRDGEEVGIDLGLKTLATLSDGRKVEMPQFYRRAEADLAKWQRYRKKKRVTALHAKIANQRKDFLHKVSTEIIRDYGRIVVGDVSPSKLRQTKMAKSISDVGWTMLKNMLRYKAIAHGVSFEIANERYTSRTCSACNARSGPKGIAGLGIREWCCSHCGTVHDRDVNAAINILGAKHRPPVVGILASQA